MSERNRATNYPGGCECMRCGCIFIGDESHDICGICESAIAALAADPPAALDPEKIARVLAMTEELSAPVASAEGPRNLAEAVAQNRRVLGMPPQPAPPADDLVARLRELATTNSYAFAAVQEIAAEAAAAPVPDVDGLMRRLLDPSLSCSKGQRGDIHREAAAALDSLRDELASANVARLNQEIRDHNARVALRDEVARLTRERDEALALWRGTKEGRDEALTELETARADARRYRWLRNTRVFKHPHDCDGPGYTQVTWDWSPYRGAPESLDDAIDAAIAASAKP